MNSADPAGRREASPGESPLMTLPEVVRFWAERTPEAPAILAPGRSALSYRALLDQVGETVRSLNRAGLGRGDRVALVLPDGPELAVAVLGIASATTAVPLSPDLPVDDLAARLADLQPRAMVVLAGGGVEACPSSAGIPVVEQVPSPASAAGCFSLRFAGDPTPALVARPQPEDVALLLYTSSTTGNPKRFPRSHRAACAVAGLLATGFAHGPTDRCLNIASMVHSQGINSMLASLVAGGSLVCTNGYDPARFFGWVEAFRPTWTATVPTVLRSIVEQIGERPGASGHTFRFVRSSAAPASPAFLAEAEAVLGVPVVSAYGMTEAPLIASPPLPPAPRKPGSVGLAFGAEIRIRDDAGVVLPPGAVGEVVVRGPTDFSGYDGDPVATAAAFTGDGWFRTGDLGYLDEDRFLFVTGRLGDVINRGGEKVSPREVEEALLAHEAVEQAVVFPVPDERLGQAVAAAVVPRGGCRVDEAALRRYVAGRLVPAKVPRRIVVVDAIPAGPNGKIRRRMLASLLAIAPAAATRGTGDRERSSVGRPPEGAMETAVVAAWTTVLGLGTVDADEAFVALGGDSIQASRVIARLRDTPGLDLSVAMFFEAATVAAMAGVLEAMLVRQAAELVPVAVRSEPEPEPEPEPDPESEPVARSRAALDEVSGGG
jgi:acyl-CoA synthetase (AMP-forming)/AMP-acid ligase II/aryl carrier-like protein